MAHPSAELEMGQHDNRHTVSFSFNLSLHDAAQLTLGHSGASLYTTSYIQ